MTEKIHSGWYLAAFASGLDGEVAPLAIGARRLVAVRTEGRLRVYDADCPHRGAHLGHGGRVEGGCLVCPFHGRRIGMGESSGEGSRPWVREHEVVECGDAVFVRLTDGPDDDRGLRTVLKAVAESMPLVKAVEQAVDAPAEIIVENAFDIEHFRAVHKVSRVCGMKHSTGAHGELVMDGEFPMPMSPWRPGLGADAPDNGPYVPRFHARAYSPGVVVTEFGPSDEVHVIVTGAVPDGRGGCVVRVALGVLAGLEDQLPQLVAGSERAVAEDVVVWENLNPRITPRFDAADAAVVAYREFCAGFAGLGDLPVGGEAL
ncbi:Rieske 2Fe-2S domain-containing protein [Streptomyces bambusae]|uniref:Rieske 2Fe-2S domain-containing protein n=1 Tax=Streptomyces bambusae TaxID=1550616 RepID=UPI001CFD6577|nr:Rieske 2Fe-2S domain-containing protein [Streptomyces bambusae]MCB5163509.1 Rieske 2Fe-2S domain-containing protein [Streptomyces bambusae]